MYDVYTHVRLVYVLKLSYKVELLTQLLQSAGSGLLYNVKKTKCSVKICQRTKVKKSKQCRVVASFKVTFEGVK